jgi:hypothetical protein
LVLSYEAAKREKEKMGGYARACPGIFFMSCELNNLNCNSPNFTLVPIWNSGRSTICKYEAAKREKEKMGGYARACPGGY